MSCPCCRAAILSAGPRACVDCTTPTRKSLLDGTFTVASGELQRSGPPPRNGIHAAAAAGDVARIRALLCSPKRPKRILWLDEFGVSPFHTAAQGDHADVVQLLLAQPGANPDINGYGATALHRACSWGSLQVARILIESGRADLNAKDTSFGDEQTPIMKAASADNADIVTLLLAAGADPERRCSRGFTACAIAAKMGARQSLRRLIDEEQDWAEPSLSHAVAAGQVETVIDLTSRMGLSMPAAEALIADAKQTREKLRVENAKSMKAAIRADTKSYIRHVAGLPSSPSSSTHVQGPAAAQSGRTQSGRIETPKNIGLKLTGNESRYRRVSGIGTVARA